ncbi:MAG: hypothetical protein NTZ98_16055 [Acidobacteria bacterium]|nr:hypothetical protein [Acidobacteriota bacterium]
MRRPIILLDLILLLAIVGLTAGIRAAWQRNHARYAVPAASSRAVTMAGLGAGTQPPLALLDYGELVNRNLFSPDRNNVQPVVKKEKRQGPPLPVVIGTMNLGSGMVALMLDPKQAASGSFKRVKTGDEIAGYKVIQIAEHKVVVELDGEQTTLDVYESAASVSAAGGAGYSAPAPGSQVQTAVAASGTTMAGDAGAPGEGGVIQSGGILLAAPSAPEGVTIEGNYRVTRRMTPLGMMTFREAIPPESKAK